MPEPTGLNDASLFCVAKQERKSEVIECGVEVDDFRVLRQIRAHRTYSACSASRLSV